MKLVLLGAILGSLMGPAAFTADAGEPLARQLLAELVAINTAPSGGDDTRPAAELLAGYLLDAGFPEADVRILGKTEKRANLVVRYRSPDPSRKPLLMMAHLDVVEALPSDWTVEPFRLTEKDGYFYGRGTSDNKAGAAMLIANLIRLRREGFRPDRDLVVMLTADEESSGAAADWLVTEHRDLIDAEYALNTDGGMVIMREGEPRAFLMQTSEKVYVSFRLAASDPGGHSSLPRPDNPIARVAAVVSALNAYRFPVDLSETTAAFFARWAELAAPGERDIVAAIAANDLTADDLAAIDGLPYYNALLRTTCVTTMIEGGHAENALPQTAAATVNCRVLPQEAVADVRNKLETLAAPHGVTLSQLAPARPSPPSPLRDDVVVPVADVAAESWPGIRVIPEMSTGATDGLFVRNAGIPVYAVSAVAEDPDDVRAHGQDERIGIRAFDDATAYWYRLVKVLAQP